MNGDGIADCNSGAANGFCECSVSILEPDRCQRTGVCTYEGGTSGGGSDSCTVYGGSWCPSYCIECNRLYFSWEDPEPSTVSTD